MASQNNDKVRDLDYENRKDRETVKTNIFYNSKLPEELKNDLIKRLDGVQAGHLGSEKIYAKISECYYWPGL